MYGGARQIREFIQLTKPHIYSYAFDPVLFHPNRFEIMCFPCFDGERLSFLNFRLQRGLWQYFGGGH